MMATKITTKDINKAIQAVKALNINPTLQANLVGTLSGMKVTPTRNIGFACNPCGKIEAWS